MVLGETVEVCAVLSEAGLAHGNQDLLAGEPAAHVHNQILNLAGGGQHQRIADGADLLAVDAVGIVIAGIVDPGAGEVELVVTVEFGHANKVELGHGRLLAQPPVQEAGLVRITMKTISDAQCSQN